MPCRYGIRGRGLRDGIMQDLVGSGRAEVARLCKDVTSLCDSIRIEVATE